jgi:hypothetical protein
LATEYVLKKVKTETYPLYPGAKTTTYEYGRLIVTVYEGPSIMGNEIANFSVFDDDYEVDSDVAIDGKAARENAEYVCREYLKIRGEWRGEIVAGEVGEPWSQHPENANLPDHIKQIIDSREYQESVQRGEEDFKAGRFKSLEEVLAKYGEADG